MEEILRMQKYLLLIRRTVGWTAESFGERIGVTRQTINNIESGRNKLTKTQYIAMRSVLDAEIAQSPDDTQMLKMLLEILIDNPDKYSDATREELLSKANIMAPSILSGSSSRLDVSKAWITAAGAVIGGAMLFPLGIPVVAPLIGGSWLAKILHDKSEKGKK